MTDKLYVKTRHPVFKDRVIMGEIQNIVERKEFPNTYVLKDGTVVEVHLNVDNINLPLDPETGTYFKDQQGEIKYNIDYHIRVVIAKPQR